MSRGTSIWLSVFALLALSVGPRPVRADVIQLTTTLPPPAGAYVVGPTLCLSAPVCVGHVVVSGFHITNETISGGNELVETTALYTADVFQNNGGSPGAPVGVLSVQGSMDFTYFGRASSSQLGTFDAQITDFDFMGTFNTHGFEFRQTPGHPSLGQTTITELRDGLFQVSSFFDVFGGFSIDHGPFTPAPERRFTLTEVPEPASMELVLVGLASLAGVARRMRSRS